jgi:vacuolar-type H+-ATPase subunit E/Vma4
MKLMEQLLSVQTYGPVDRYLRAGAITIKGQELLAEALMQLLDEGSIKEQTKLLESLKAEVKDWQAIDTKIEELDNNKTNYKVNNKVNILLEKYDSETLVEVLKEKVKSINDISLLEEYIKSFNQTSVDINKVSNIINERIKEIKTPS